MIKKFFSIAIACALLTACSGNMQQNTDTAEVPETIEIEQDEEALAHGFFQNLYNNYVFGNEDFANISKNFAPDIVQKLKDDYDFDGEGYAVWELRSGNQDGDSDVCSVDSVVSEGNGWYKVWFTDMGTPGSHRFKLSRAGDAIYVQSFE